MQICGFKYCLRWLGKKGKRAVQLYTQQSHAQMWIMVYVLWKKLPVLKLYGKLRKRGNGNDE